MQRGIFISGIGTEIGKTVVAALITQALAADYWKPVQSGDLSYSDTMKVKALASHPAVTFHPEAFSLNTPASPHYSAELDGVQIKVTDFKLPQTNNFLVVEGAGGLMVPLNQSETMVDLIKHLGLPVLLVSQNYLGSINHSLLSLQCLQQHDIPLAGLIFNGPAVPSTTDIIEQMSGQKALFHLPPLAEINQTVIADWAEKIKPILQKEFFSKNSAHESVL